MHWSNTMPTDFPTLLRRDHADFQDELTQLLDPAAGSADLCLALDGLRLGLTAHTEAEDIVLGKFEMIPALEILIAQARAAHLSQEHALSALVSSQPQTVAWRDRAHHLRELVGYHAAHEEKFLLPALRRHVSTDHFAKLAGAFATERLRQLAMLQPSAPFYIPGFAEAHAS